MSFWIQFHAGFIWISMELYERSMEMILLVFFHDVSMHNMDTQHLRLYNYGQKINDEYYKKTDETTMRNVIT